MINDVMLAQCQLYSWSPRTIHEIPCSDVMGHSHVDLSLYLLLLPQPDKSNAQWMLHREDTTLNGRMFRNTHHCIIPNTFLRHVNTWATHKCVKFLHVPIEKENRLFCYIGLHLSCNKHLSFMAMLRWLGYRTYALAFSYWSLPPRPLS